jgi:hypothetical protein
MRAYGEPCAMKVCDDALFVIHRLKRRRGVRFWQLFEKRSRKAHGALDLPKSVPAVEF